jgi:hypothetical protein
MSFLHATPHNQHSSSDKAMQPEQFTQVIEAILAGKYSWACVLILRFSGYNPLHYIRIVKDNKTPNSGRSPKPTSDRQTPARKPELSARPPAKAELEKMTDLVYLEALDSSASAIRGGTHAGWSFYRRLG